MYCVQETQEPFRYVSHYDELAVSWCTLHDNALVTSRQDALRIARSMRMDGHGVQSRHW